MKIAAFVAGANLVLAAAALADGTVTLTLSSPANGMIVTPGTTITWTISAAVTSADNDGLAGVCVDLVQSPDNPAYLDIPPGTINTPPNMEGFVRPAGISNPVTALSAGYWGTQTGSPGRRNLAQIGGAQNVFGAPGTTIGQDAQVERNIGQQQAQTILTGSFAAPPGIGVYSFLLQSAVATVIVKDSNPARAVAALVSPVGFQFTVQYCLADFNRDGFIDGIDYDQFNYAFETGDMAADINGDGFVDGIDYDLFNAAFEGGC